MSNVQDKSRRTVLLAFGGESSEHDVSVRSAKNVYEAIDKTSFTIVLVFIDKAGRWWLVDEMVSELSNSGEEIVPVLGRNKLISLSSGRIVIPDVLLPILHGKNGEDGTIQALGQLLHIPVVGCDMTASALCMDKVATKEILSANNIPNVPYKTHRVGDIEVDFDVLTSELSTPLFIKPARAGSSVGVSKVSTVTEFSEAMRLAHEHDGVVLIEKAIKGRELEVAVLGNPPHHSVSGVGEIVAGADYYTYEAKYSVESTSETVVPADLPPEVTDEIKAIAYNAYATLGCRGMARIDFFLSETGKLYVNEVNTIPGFTDISMYPKLWQNAGVTYPELITRLISLAVGDTIRTE